MGDYLTHTVSGNIASFKSADIMPIESLKCHFLPTQEGSGDPSPTNIRNIIGWNNLNTYIGKKNIIPFFSEEIGPFSTYVNGQAYMHANTDLVDKISQGQTVTFSVYIDATNAEDNTLYSSVRIWAKKADGTWGYLAKEGTKIYNGSEGWSVITISFPSDYYYISYGIGLRIGAVASHPMVEYGITRTEYEPYNSKTIPITFPALGKNKFNINVPFQNPDNTTASNSSKRIFTPYTFCKGIASTNYWKDSDITYTIANDTITITSPTAYGLGFVLPLTPGDYRISCVGSEYRINAIYYAEDGTYLSCQNSLQSSSGSFTVPSECIFTVIMFTSKTNYVEATFSNIQVELGTTITTYESYTNTVYGGYIDMITGEIVKTHQLINLTASGIYTLTDGAFWYTSGIQNLESINEGVVCNRCKVVSNVSGKEQYNAFTWYSNNIVRWTDIGTYDMTKTEYNEYLEEHPIIVTYKLSTPQVVGQLSPIELRTYLNQNNIWSNTNDITEVTYTFQDHLLQQRMLIKQPHIETATGSITSFNTDIKASLKSAKFYFNPIQEGSGDPSPENVRNISGWTELKVKQTGKNMINTADNITYNTGYIERYWGVDSWATKNIPDGSLFLPAGTYGISIVNNANKVAEWRVIDKNNQYLDHAYNGHNFRTFTNPESQSLILYLNSQDIANGTADIQLEIGSSKTSYEPYNGQTIILDWTSTAGILYGGYVDLISGELYQTWYKKNIAEYTWNKWGSQGLMYVNHTDIPRLAGTPVYCDSASIDGTGNPQLKTKGVIGYYEENTNYPSYFFIQTDIDTSTTEGHVAARAYITETFANTNVVYQLATPELITTLTPTQLKSLVGTNNIWSNANGNVEVKYWTH